MKDQQGIEIEEHIGFYKCTRCGLKRKWWRTIDNHKCKKK